MSNLKPSNGALCMLGLFLIIFSSCHLFSPSLTDIKKRDNKTPKLLNIEGTRNRIDSGTARKMAALADQYPLLLDDKHRTVLGFHFKQEDFDQLTQLKPASVFFRIGIRNYQDADRIATGDADIQYTIIVLPLNADMTQMKDANGPVAFDFVCPCPGASCCPKP